MQTEASLSTYIDHVTLWSSLLCVGTTWLTSLPSPCFHPRSLAFDIHSCNFTLSSIFQFPISPLQPTCFVAPWLYQALSSHYSRVGHRFSLTWLWSHRCLLQLTLCRLQHFQSWKLLTNHVGHFTIQMIKCGDYRIRTPPSHASNIKIHKYCCRFISSRRIQGLWTQFQCQTNLIKIAFGLHIILRLLCGSRGMLVYNNSLSLSLYSSQLKKNEM